MFHVEQLKSLVAVLPETFGCYQYLDKDGKIIYVGKAKNLRKRVASYFTKEHDSFKTRLLVRHICDIKYVVVNNEEDALLLENNLIKKHQPKYNVLLKDGKTYPYLCITKEEYPRIYKTRRVDKRTGVYFGPYSHHPTIQGLYELISRAFKFRTCNLPLTHENVANGRYKVCLDYHIHRCEGVCVGKVSYEEYRDRVLKAAEILRGRADEISREYYERMLICSEKLQYEEAHEAKLIYELLENYRAKSEVVNRSVNNVDVFSIVSDERAAYINYLHLSNGAINQAFTFEYKKRLDEDDDYLLSLGITEMRERFESTAREIVVSVMPDTQLSDVKYTIPKSGDRKRLLDLSLLNVKQYKADALTQADKLNPEQRITRTLTEIKEQLHLDRLPYRIECFDNSHIQGSNAVAGCVVFVKGKPAKSEYRKYQIKEAQGGDDYGSMLEVARRRYARIVSGEILPPDLIIVDGGEAQMAAMRIVVEGEYKLPIPIIGLAKNRKHHTSEVLCGNPPVTLGIKQGTPVFRLLESIQTEVHRFAITYHKALRSKAQLHSSLDDIKGIGKQSKSIVLKKYKSVGRIKEASEQELATLIGQHKAALLKQALTSQQNKDENSNSES